MGKREQEKAKGKIKGGNKREGISLPPCKKIYVIDKPCPLTRAIDKAY